MAGGWLAMRERGPASALRLHAGRDVGGRGRADVDDEVGVPGTDHGATDLDALEPQLVDDATGRVTLGVAEDAAGARNAEREVLEACARTLAQRRDFRVVVQVAQLCRDGRLEGAVA
jgi:hypothetical protein